MRYSTWSIRTVLFALAMAACGRNGMTVGVGAPFQMGPGIDIYGYTADRYGEWHANYQQWTPAIVYEVNGRYYDTNVRGGRAIQVYHNEQGFFLPPREPAWLQVDKRFDRKKLPNDSDYVRVHHGP